MSKMDMVFVSVADKKFRFLCQKPAKPVIFFGISLVSDRIVRRNMLKKLRLRKKLICFSATP